MQHGKLSFCFSHSLWHSLNLKWNFSLHGRSPIYLVRTKLCMDGIVSSEQTLHCVVTFPHTHFDIWLLHVILLLWICPYLHEWSTVVFANQSYSVRMRFCHLSKPSFATITHTHVEAAFANDFVALDMPILTRMRDCCVCPNSLNFE